MRSDYLRERDGGVALTPPQGGPTFARVRRIAAHWLVWTSSLVFGGGCGGPVAPPRGDLFAPVAMRIHPVFTQLKDTSGDGKPDGVEALVQLTDAFGDTTKGAGTVVLELFDYRRNFPDPRGERLAPPAVVALLTVDDQRRYWRRVGAAYALPLPYPQVSPKGYYVVTTTFTPAAGGDRMFDRIVLVPAGARDGQQEPADDPTTRPATTRATTAR